MQEQALTNTENPPATRNKPRMVSGQIKNDWITKKQESKRRY